MINSTVKALVRPLGFPSMIKDGLAEPQSPGGSEVAFREFAGRLQRGEEGAARELLSRYSARLVALAQQRLGRRMMPKGDAEDVLQSVFRTFFRRIGEGRIELRNWESLSGLLSLLTLRKCCKQARAYQTAQRDVGLEVSLQGTGSDSFRIDVPDREPSPDEVVMFAELFERVLAGLEESDRETLERLLAGASVDEIAAKRNRSRRSVQRALARIRQQIMSASHK